MKDNQKKAWLFLAPAIVCVTVFSIWPILRAFTMSFEGGPLIDLHFNGFSNYQYIFSDPEFWRAIMNTAIYSFLAVPIALIVSVALAWFIFQKLSIQLSLKQCSLCHMLQVQLQSELFFATSSMVNMAY